MAEYCVYLAGGDAERIGISAGDTICVDCPPDGVCPSGGGVGIILENIETGEQQTVSVQSQGSQCRGCPSGGKSGYRFPGEKKGGW